MPIDATVDQIVVVGRASTRERDFDRYLWAHELQLSRTLDPVDLTVQVKLIPYGCWHRKAIGGKTTACGKPLGGFASRDESYAGDLCDDGCFTTYEQAELARLTPDHDPVPYHHDDDD